MNWFIELLTEQTFIQAVTVISLICAAGLIFGKIRIFGISLGATFVFFAGIAAQMRDMTVTACMNVCSVSSSMNQFIVSIR